MKPQTYSKTDLAMSYGVTLPILEKWLESIFDEIGWVKGAKQKFTPKQVNRIFEHLGKPL